MPEVPINLIHAQELSPYTDILNTGGASAQNILEKNGIPGDAVQDEQAMITMWQGYQFVDASAMYAGIENLGSIAGRNVSLLDLGPLGRTLLSAPCFGSASRSFTSAMNATEPGSKCWIDTNDNEAWVCYRPMVRFECGGAQAEQFDLQCLLSMVRLASGPEWTPRKIKVCAAQVNVLRNLEEFANCEILSSERTTAIAFPKEFFAKPLEKHALVSSQREKGDREDTFTFSVSAASAVEAVMESLSGYEQIPVLESIAERFGVSGRTLQRYLEAEGVSFQELMDRLMYRRATKLLVEESIPVKAVSFELGFSSSASFVRAFRRYSGVTPAAFRKSQRE